MKKIPKWVVVLVAAIVVIVVAWNIKYPSGKWRYKITVAVETPEGIKTGSAVREVTAHRQPGFLGVSESGFAGAKGEAVVVDLDKRGVLFYLMDIDGSYQIVFQSFPMPGKKRGVGGTTVKGIQYYSHLKNVQAEISPKKSMEFGQWVSFKDLNDPKSVYEVSADNLSKSFGTGVEIEEIVIEMTNAPVTWEIEDYLPWLKGSPKGYLDGAKSGGGPALSNQLSFGNLKRNF